MPPKPGRFNVNNLAESPSVQQQQQKVVTTQQQKFAVEEPKWVFPPYQIDQDASLQAPRAQQRQISLLRTVGSVSYSSPSSIASNATVDSMASPTNQTTTTASSASPTNNPNNARSNSQFGGAASSSFSGGGGSIASSPNYSRQQQQNAQQQQQKQFKIVAVKQLPCDGALKNWVRELRMANFRISHPNIVLYLACAPVSAIDQHQKQQKQQQTTSVSSSATSLSSSNLVELHMEYAERLCLDRFIEDLAFLIEQRRTKLVKKLMDEYQCNESLDGDNNNNMNMKSESHQQQQNLVSPTKANLHTAREMAFSGVEPMIEACLKCVAKQALVGLAALHEIHETLHRDMKPGNLLVFANGHIKLTDFETAIPVPADHASQTHNVGTTRFQAPEVKASCFSKQQDQTKERKRKADIWSLGVTLLLSKMRLLLVNGTSSKSTNNNNNNTTPSWDENDWPRWAKTVNGYFQEQISATTASDEKELQQKQACIDCAVENVFVDPALRYLVKLMLRYNIDERANVLHCLSWTFTLTNDLCSNAAIVADLFTKNSSNSQFIQQYNKDIQKWKKPSQHVSKSSSARFEFGWSVLTPSHRDLEAERELKSCGIETCDHVLVQDKKIESFAELTARVSQIEAALRQECCAVSKLVVMSSSSSSSSSSTATPDFELLQSLVYRRIWYRREVDEIELMKEIVALTPIPK